MDLRVHNLGHAGAGNQKLKEFAPRPSAMQALFSIQVAVPWHFFCSSSKVVNCAQQPDVALQPALAAAPGTWVVDKYREL
jgi:hypothetical protein